MVRDVQNDSEAKISENKDGYLINAKVNYPNNAKLATEVITTDKKFNIKNIEVLDVDGNKVLTVNLKNVDYNPHFDKEYFNLDKLVQIEETDKKENDKKEPDKKKDEECISTCKEDDKTCENKCETESTSNVLDEIIYPLYVPADTYLSNKDTVNTDEGNRVILTFAGTDPFILVEEVSKTNDEMEIIPVSGEPLMLGSTIGAITANSLYWTSNGVDYYLTSKTLDSGEMMTIAESITNSSSLVASTK